LQKLLSPEISRRDPLSFALMRKERDGATGGNFGTLVAEGDGWRVLDVVCTAGPRDRPFEERHAWQSVSLVRSGTFTYRGGRGTALISAGSMVLGSVGRGFECSHQHGAGDRCISFQFTPALFESIARDGGAPRATLSHDRLPPLRELAPLTARIATASSNEASLEEIALELADAVIHLTADDCRESATTGRDRARIADVLHHLETRIDQPHALSELASIAGLSRYHFLRTFSRVTGITPHQWILRARLREAARRLATSSQAITEIALDVGFEDLSNFIRSFHAEFGISPRGYRGNLSLR
jgi:AraC family transcriptional regulator